MRKKSILLIKVILTLSITASCETELIEPENESNKIETIGNKQLNEFSYSSPFPYCQNDPNPIGGASGYTNIINSDQADIVISTFTSPMEFKTIIESAPEGSVIYIANNLEIDLTNFHEKTGSHSIFLNNKNITIASGRGHNSDGALIKTNDFDYDSYKLHKNQPVFEIKADNIRITGLRLQGPYQEECICNTSTPDSTQIKVKYGILNRHNDNLEVDNCKLYGWPTAAIQIGIANESGIYSNNNKIHHNYIYNNRQRGYGYGCAINYGYAEISSNIFKQNRHDIAGSGNNGCSYEASCNTILQGGTSHNFDMHAEAADDKSENAGSYIFIHHNDFHDIGGNLRYHGNNNENIKLRGRPDNICRIENNRFLHPDPNMAIKQSNSEGGYGNMVVSNNIYDSKYRGWYIPKNWTRTGNNDFLQLYSGDDKLMFEHKHYPSDYTYAYNYGDFDGDGLTDLYKLENGKLYVIPLNKNQFNPSSNWQLLATTNYSMNSLRFGYFNDDNITDLIYWNNGRIYVSWDCSTNWQTLVDTNYNFSILKFGDFDGNGITDLFLADGNTWYASTDYSSNWNVLVSNAPFTSNTLLIGHFNNNNKSDVFQADGSNFRVSYSGKSSWDYISTSSYTTNRLISVDFDGDGLTDIINDNGEIGLSGRITWQKLNTNNFPIENSHYLKN